MKEKVTHRVPLGEYPGGDSPYPPRESWGKGPWDDEPDRVEWTTLAGLPALITRSPLTGSFCGYVAVLPGHPLHGIGYNEEKTSELDAHGGITYASPCSEHICHVPEPGEPEDVWWFGFDCGHAFDVMPAMETMFQNVPGMPQRPAEFDEYHTYRDLAYVRANCEALAAQLALAAAEP